MNNVIFYLRVSTKEQLEGTSIDVQQRICQDFSDRNNFEVVKIFTEKGESAKNADRTELKKLLEFVAKNHKTLFAVIVYKIDRFARNTLDHAQLKLFFSRYGIKLLSATENLEDNPVGRLIENQLAGFAQFDNEIRTERSKNGMIEAVKKGRYVWSAPIGYINTGGRGVSNLAYDKSEIVNLVRKLWELIDSGYDIVDARKWLAKEGLTISESQVHRMLRNKIYMGVIEKFGLSVVGEFKPLIEPQLFIRVFNNLLLKGKKMPIYRVNHPDFPIRGLIKHECDVIMTASWSTGNGGKYGYYRCKRCKGVNYQKNSVEADFLHFLNEYAYKPYTKELLLKAIKLCMKGSS